MNRTVAFIATIAFTIFLFAPGYVEASYVGNLIDYTGVQNTVSTTGLGGVYRFTGGSWQPVAPAFNALLVDDVVVSVLKATKLMSTGTFYDHSYAGEFTGYLALRVKEVKGAPDFYYVFDVGTVNGWDPFGKLQANEALAIYLEPTKDFNVNAPITGSGIRLTDVAWATDGSLFATFGFGSVGPSEEVRGFYSAVNLTILGHLEVLQNPGAWQWLGVVSLPAVGSVTNDLALDNLTFTRPAPSSAAWDSKTDDGLRFRLVPEPATLASLFGLGAAGGLGWIFRRRKLS